MDVDGDGWIDVVSGMHAKSIGIATRVRRLKQNQLWASRATADTNNEITFYMTWMVIKTGVGGRQLEYASRFDGMAF